MLAQSFKTADELGITERQRDALAKTLVLLETDKIIHVVCPDSFSSCDDATQFTGHFNMNRWNAVAYCGSVCCIGGTAELVGGLPIGTLEGATIGNKPLKDLFFPSLEGNRWRLITPNQAATALRSYLTTGEASWDLAVA